MGSPSLGKTLGLPECNDNRLIINKGKKMKDSNLNHRNQLRSNNVQHQFSKDIDKQIEEVNEDLKNYKKEDLNITSSMSIILVILTGWVFALILFFIDIFVA